MRLRFMIALAALGGCATTAPSQQPPAASSASSSNDGLSVLAAMRQVRARVAQGQAPQVHAKLEKEISDRPNDFLPRFLDIVAEMPSDDAWQKFKDLSMADAANPWPQIGMAMIYTTWTMYPQAKTTLDQAEALRPGFLPTELVRAQLLQHEGTLDATQKAQADFEAIAKRADIPEAHAGLGEIALARGNLVVAKEELSLAAKGDPSILAVQKALGKVALESNDDAAALAAYRHIVADSPNDVASLRELAKLEEATGDIDPARRDFRKAVAMGGINLETAKHLVSLARKANDSKGLVSALKDLTRVDPKEAEPQFELAEALLAQKDPKAAEVAYRDGLALDKQNAKATWELARLYRDQKQDRQAIETYTALLAMPNPPPQAQGELGALTADLKLPKKPISGSVNRINEKFTADLNRFYQLRLRVKPHLKGTLRLAVNVGADGKVISVALTSDDVKDPLLLNHAYFVMKRAQFPHAKRNPVFVVELHR